MKIGVMVESFRAGLEGGLSAAAELGADGVQMYAVKGETHPDAMTADRRCALRKRLSDLGLELAAVCADFGGHGFQIEQENPDRIAQSKKVMDLAVELGCRVVTTHIGVVPEEKSHPRYATLARACEELGKYGRQVGATFAIETGPERAAVLRSFLDDIGLPEGMGVNFDPANLVMVFNEDIPAAVELLGPYIVHTHAKDGRQLQPVNAEKLYGAVPLDAGEELHWDQLIAELPLGRGNVPWDAYPPALAKAGFDGYLTIEREVGEQPRKDIADAISFLRKLLRR